MIAVGESSGRALQALVRTDPGGFAAREMAERTQAGFPPSVRVVVVEGAPETLADFAALTRLPAGAEILGPVEVSGTPDSNLQRLVLRSPRGEGAALLTIEQAKAEVERLTRELADAKALVRELRPTQLKAKPKRCACGCDGWTNGATSFPDMTPSYGPACSKASMRGTSPPWPSC